MDSMVNRYTSDRKIRTDDAYTPNAAPGKRPDRSVIVYSQKVRQAFKNTPIVLGGIESSLRRIAHYDYWSEKIRRSVLLDAKADLLLFGNAERALVDVAHRIASGASIKEIKDIRGTVFVSDSIGSDWVEQDSTAIDRPGKTLPPANPYQMVDTNKTENIPVADAPISNLNRRSREKTLVRLPSYETVRDDPVMYAHTSRVLHLESNPGNARILIQQHGDRDVWINPPPIPLEMEEMDKLYELPYAREPHPSYGKQKIPAFDMIRFSVTIQRGCFGGCTFCSITEHEGRIIQNRSEKSIVREVEHIRDKAPDFTGVISDLGGPTANMYRLACKSKSIETSCRKLSCVYPRICPNLNTNHNSLINLYRKVRSLSGIKKVLIGSGVRYDLAIESPDYVKELAQHHVGGYLKIAPEAIGEGPLSKMMKPGVGTYHRFKELFDRYSKQAGKEQYLIPYFIAAHPGTTDEDMLELAIWLKSNGFRADQVQSFLPSPMALATAMYHSEKNPLRKVTDTSEDVIVPKGLRKRRLHKAFLRYHDPENWPLLRDTLKKMGRADLIGPGKKHLIPQYQPKGTGFNPEGSRRPKKYQVFRTTHNGLPKNPRSN
jgi:uncharacterized radical SAM protein YgiQ